MNKPDHVPENPAQWLSWTTKQQSIASDPARFAWVSANAGSGKTHVLTQRVIRLLLSGARPSSILCLTYTKAAASEMSNRVFKTLSGWSLLDDAALSSEIERMEGTPPARHKLAEARRLFARALDTPGGLKIQTIHAFCEALLHQFPLEANVAGHFSVLDDRGSANLLADVKRNLLVAASAEDDKALAAAFATVMDYGSDFGLETLIGEVLNERSGIAEFQRSLKPGESLEAALRTALKLDPAEDKNAIFRKMGSISGFSELEAKDYIAHAQGKGGAKVLETAEKLSKALAESDIDARASLMADVFLKKDGNPRANGAFFNKAMEKEDAGLEMRFAQAIHEISELQDSLKKLDLLEASLAALFIANRLNHDYEDLKKRQGLLDFDDLIERAANLLTKSEAGPWIHYKLDQGIDHILVDEAQDTSPVQWRIIQALSEEFFAGQSAKESKRTMFAVGDEKQSIYSFQGARPEKFSDEGRAVQNKAKSVDFPFDQVRLPLSFRSTSHVLSAVDQVFSVPENRKGLSALDEDVIHQSSRSGHPGMTAVWEIIAPAEVADEEDWTLPFDATPESAPPAILARRIADTISGWLGKEMIWEKDKLRPMEPGDILVLVRKRDGFANALTRALKSRNNIPVGGADRLVLTSHIAIQDLMALGRFILLPEDDLSLAALSKSPLINLSEEDLMLAAAGRDKNVSLWQRFKTLADENPLFAETAKVISAWQNLAANSSPFEFFSRILGPLGGRRKILARLGSEAADVLDEFLNIALEHDQNSLPGLQSFISALELEPPTVKREQDKDRNEVRIMTVHASKGLEAPVVFLIDDCSAAFNANHLPKIRLIGQPSPLPSIPLWIPSSDMNIALTDADKERRKELAEEEYRRLLYVGMTRAADRLVICGHRKKRENDSSWHKMVSSALAADPVRCREETFKTQADEWAGLIWNSGEALRDLERERPDEAAEKKHAFPDSLFRRLPDPVRLPKPLSPSGAAAVLDDDMPEMRAGSRLFDRTKGGAGAAAQRGRIIHRLFQSLPDFEEKDRQVAAKRYLERAAAHWSDAERQNVIEQVFAVMNDPLLGAIFKSSAKAEANVMGVLKLGEREFAVSGRIDRLAIEEERIIISDFKTDRRPPENLAEISDTYITQLAIYRSILQPLYEGKTVECSLIFTCSGRAFTLPADKLDEALARFG